MADFDLSAVLGFITIESLVLLMVGVAVGVIFGAIPGLTGSIGLALALPFTITLGTIPAMGLLIGIYKGGMFGGAISAIAFGIPGTPSSAPTVFDGYPMAKRGEARKGLEVAHLSGFTADVFSDLVLIFTFAPLAMIALRMTPREMFALMVVALAVLATFAGASLGRAVIAVGAGLLIASVGPDPIVGSQRMTFGLQDLRGGIQLIPLIVGLFAMSEVMFLSANLFGVPAVERKEKAELRTSSLKSSRTEGHLSFREWATLWRETLIGALLGTVIGALPGPGGTLASFTSYGIAGGLKRNRGTFGTGNPAGVAAAESADSATAGATLIPLFGLGIPGSAMAALFAAALQLQGITPGPTMLRTQGNIVYAILASLLIGSLFLFVFAKLIIPFYASLANVSMRILTPTLALLSVLGVYAISPTISSVVVMIVAGVVGYLFRLHHISVGAVIMVYIVGSSLEANFRRGQLLAMGDWTYWFRSPVAVAMYGIGIFVAAYLYHVTRKSARQRSYTEVGAPKE